MNSHRNLAARGKAIPFKILLIGAQNTGKTTLVNRFVTGNYINENNHINIQVYHRNLAIEDKVIRFEIWDMPGLLYPDWLYDNDLDKVQGIMLCIDITNTQSVKYIEKWQKVFSVNFPEIKLLLVGTKCETIDRKFTFIFGREKAEKFGCKYIEVSSVQNYNIEKCFRKLYKNATKFSTKFTAFFKRVFSKKALEY